MAGLTITDRRAAGAALAWAALLLWLSLHPFPGEPGGARWLLVGPPPAVADMVANAIAYVPLGLLAALATGRARVAVLACAALSGGIEVAQGLGIPGRYATLSDLASNVAGGALGAWLAVARGMLLRPSRAQARILLVAGAGLVAALIALTAWLEGPGRPSARYEGQYSELWHRERLPEYSVQFATFNGRPFAWGIYDDPAAVTRALAAQRIRLEAALYPGPPEPGEHRLAAMSAPGQPSPRVARLSTVGRHVLFSVRTRAEEFGLHAPFVMLRDGLPPSGGAPGGSLNVGGGQDGPLLAVWVDDGIRARVAQFTMSPLDTWQFVVPPSITRRAPPGLFRGLEMLLLFGPLAWWAWAMLRTRREPGTA